MRRLWNEFKSIAISGSVLDLALGFIIGAAFAKLIESFVGNIFMQLVAATFGQPDFREVSINIGKTKVTYGAFLTDVLNFLLLAVALFVIVKMMLLMGVERGRSLDQRPCPYCLQRTPSTALICASCGQTLVEELPSLAEAERLLAERQARKWPTLPRRGSGPDSGTPQVTAETTGTAAGAASTVLDQH
jgi:large conductance mechanosensitive channel